MGSVCNTAAEEAIAVFDATGETLVKQTAWIEECMAGTFRAITAELNNEQAINAGIAQRD
jgi:hypothetical protein